MAIIIFTIGIIPLKVCTVLQRPRGFQADKKHLLCQNSIFFKFRRFLVQPHAQPTVQYIFRQLKKLPHLHSYNILTHRFHSCHTYNILTHRYNSCHIYISTISSPTGTTAATPTISSPTGTTAATPTFLQYPHPQEQQLPHLHS